MSRHPSPRALRPQAAATRPSSQKQVSVAARAGLEPLEPRRLFSTVAALTDNNQLLIFDPDRAQTVIATRTVSGLEANETLLAIDVRPATGQLYALGSENNLYVVNPSTGAASGKLELTADPTDTSDPFTAVNGTDFGIDFNPAVDRLRVVSNADQNLRINPNTGLVITDTPLTYDTTDVNTGRNPSVVDVAYTNNDNDAATPTTLLGIDNELFNSKMLTDGTTVPALNLVRQGGADGAAPSPNAGQLFTVGAFGREGAATRGFDIAPSGTAYVGVQATFPTRTEWLIVSIDPATGADQSRGAIGSGATAVRDIAVLPSFQLSTQLYATTEDAGMVTITVTRTEGSAGSATVDLTTVLGTAQLGTDFTNASQTLTFAEGETSKTVTISVANDVEEEADEFFVVTLSNPTGGGATLGANSAAVVRVSANDLEEGDEDGPRLLKVLLTGPSRGISGAVFHFDEDLDPATAQNVANYTFTAKPQRGRKQTITFNSAVYDPAMRTVTLTVTPFMQTEFTQLELSANRKRGGIQDVAGNRLEGTNKFRFNVFSGESITFTDRDGDRATLSIANGGRLDGITPVKAPKTQRTQFWILDPIPLRSTLSGSVTQSPRGDGIVVISEIIGLDKKEFTPLLSNTSFRVNTLTFSSNATGIG